MTTTIVDALWPRLQATLEAFADKLVAADSALICNLGRTENGAFILRGYLALRRLMDGDEIAVTIDVRSDGQQLTLESDACNDDVSVIAVGPSAVIPLIESQSNIETVIGEWFREFERFFLEQEPALVTALFKLP